MRPIQFAAIAASIVGGVLVIGGPGFSQSPPERSRSAHDELRAMLRQVENALDAPREVDREVLEELRKQYRRPTLEREAEILKEIRRLYVTTPESELSILREMRAAYQQPTAEQEERVFREIRRGGLLPAGTIPVSVQIEEAIKLFRRLDANRDGVLGSDEQPETLQTQRGHWDKNRDLTIDVEEYSGYYQTSLKTIAEAVAAGKFPLRLPRRESSEDRDRERNREGDRSGTERTNRDRAAGVPPAPKLPDWFTKFDLDNDGQIGLYEWRKHDGAIEKFVAMDPDDDGFLTEKELLAYLSEQQQQDTERTRKQ